MDDLVGVRFHPTDEEIIRLLEKKRLDPGFTVHTITEANIYNFEPGELFGLSQIQSDGKWCSFFCAPDYINADSDRVHRSTKTGYWKLTGKGSEINAKGGTGTIGRKSIFTFYKRGQGPKGTKTDLVMHQFSAKDNPLYKKDFVVCRVKRNGDKKRRNSTFVEGHRHKKLHTSTEVERQQHQNLLISIRDEGQGNHHLAFDNHCHATENIFPESNFLPSNYPVSNSRNHDAENTFLESQLPPNGNLISKFRNHVEESTLISESRNCIEENTSPELQLLLQFLQSNYHVRENASPELLLPSNDYLISEFRNHGEENTSPELELLSQLPTNAYLISEYRNHVEENTSPELQLLQQFLPSNYMISESRNHVEETTSQELQLLPQFLPSNCMISESRNHVEETTSQELQLLPQFLSSNYMIFESTNHVEENSLKELQLLQQCLPSNNLISVARNHVEGNISPEQLLLSNFLISNSRNQVVENTSPKSQLQSSNNLISNSGNQTVENVLPVYSDLPIIWNALNGGNELDEASFSALQSLINQEQESSYSSVASSDYPPFGSEWENDFMNPGPVIHDPDEGTGHCILPLYFNSREADGEFYGGDNRDRH